MAPSNQLFVSMTTLSVSKNMTDDLPLRQLLASNVKSVNLILNEVGGVWRCMHAQGAAFA